MTIRRRTHTLAVAVALAVAGLMACSTPATGNADEQKQDRTVSQAIRDAGITARVKATYIFNPHLNPFRIDVDTQDGVVTLHGTVKSGIQKDLAGEIAKNADGVQAVRNDLEVKSEGETAAPEDSERSFAQAVRDATTTASVKMALAFERGVKAHEIDVSTYDGTVTLDGKVGTMAEVQLAGKTAEDVTGVHKVVNNLEVSG